MDDKNATYLTNLPPHIGWFKGSTHHKTYHLVTCAVGFRYKTLCGQELHHPLAAQYWSGSLGQVHLCLNCRRMIDTWRSANAVEQESNTAPP